VRTMNELPNLCYEDEERMREFARKKYAAPNCRDIEIDPEAPLNVRPGGAFVQSWVWVSFHDAGLVLYPQARIPDPPRLFLPSPARPLVMRVLGSPYQFRSHWMRKPSRAVRSLAGSAEIVDAHTADGNELALCGACCSACEKRQADRMWLVPVLVAESGSRKAGFLMIQSAALRRVARMLQDKDRDRTDIILFHKAWNAWNEGMCDVYSNPPEDLPGEELEMGRESCAFPEDFLTASFREASAVGGDPIRPPMMIVSRHLEESPVMEGGFERETDMIVDALESAMLRGVGI
jgi:hypothetical protein